MEKRTEVWYTKCWEFAEDVTNRLTGRWCIHKVNGRDYLWIEIAPKYKLPWCKPFWVDSYHISIEEHEEVVFSCRYLLGEKD